jgi:hypothetical protein
MDNDDRFEDPADRGAWSRRSPTAERAGDERFWPDRRLGMIGADPRGRARGQRFWRRGGDDDPLVRSDAWQRPDDHWMDRAYAGRPLVGPHVGKGPRGWPGDERIRDEVSDVLTHDPGVDASDVEVDVEDGEVTLLGTVADRGQKRRAEARAERVRGVRDVHNRIRVADIGE